MSPRPSKRRIAIIGAGFTGSVLAAHLLRCADEPTSLHLIERMPSVGAGLAYSTPNAAHLLNVRAYNMSAYPDDPRHFLRWLWAREDGGASIPPSGHAFVSRALYGAYIQDVLREAVAEAPANISLDVLQAETVDVETDEGTANDRTGVRLRFADGSALTNPSINQVKQHLAALPG